MGNEQFPLSSSDDSQHIQFIHLRAGKDSSGMSMEDFYLRIAITIYSIFTVDLKSLYRHRELRDAFTDSDYQQPTHQVAPLPDPMISADKRSH